MIDDSGFAPENNIPYSDDIRSSFLCCGHFHIFTGAHGEIESTDGELGNSSLSFGVLEFCYF